MATRRPALFLLPKLLEAKEYHDNIPLRYTLSSMSSHIYPYLTQEEYDEVQTTNCQVGGNYDALIDLNDDIKKTLEHLHFPMLAITLAGYEVTKIHFHNPRAYSYSPVAEVSGNPDYADSYVTVDLTTMSFQGNTLSEGNPWSAIESYDGDVGDYEAAFIFEIAPRSYLNGFIETSGLNILSEASSNPNLVIGEKGIGVLLLETQPADGSDGLRPGGNLSEYVFCDEGGLYGADDSSDLWTSVTHRLTLAWNELYTAYDAYKALSEEEQAAQPSPITSKQCGLLTMFLPDSWKIHATSKAQKAILQSASQYAYEALKKDISFQDETYGAFEFPFEYPYKISSNFFTTLIEVFGDADDDIFTNFGEYVGVGRKKLKEEGNLGSLSKVNRANLGEAIEHCFLSTHTGYMVVPETEDTVTKAQNNLPPTFIKELVDSYHYVEAVLLMQELCIIDALVLDYLTVLRPEWTDPDITGFYEEIPTDNDWSVYRDDCPDIGAAGTLFPMDYVDTLQLNQAGTSAIGFIQEKDQSTSPQTVDEYLILTADVEQDGDGVSFTMALFEKTVNFLLEPIIYDADGNILHSQLVKNYVGYVHYMTAEEIGWGDWLNAIRIYESAEKSKRLRATTEFAVLDLYEYSPDASYDAILRRFVRINANPYVSPRHYTTPTKFNELFKSSQQAPFHSIETANLFIAVHRLIYFMRSYPASKTRAQLESSFASDISWLWGYGQDGTARLDVATLLGLNIYSNYVSDFNALINMVQAEGSNPANTIADFFLINDKTPSYTYEEGEDPWLRHYSWWEVGFDPTIHFELKVDVGVGILSIDKKYPEDELWDDPDTSASTDTARYLYGKVGLGLDNIYGIPTDLGVTLWEDSSEPDLQTWLCTWGNWTPGDFTGQTQGFALLGAQVTLGLLDYVPCDATVFGNSVLPLNYTLLDVTLFISFPRMLAQEDSVGLSISLPAEWDYFKLGYSSSRTRRAGLAAGITPISVAGRAVLCISGWGFNTDTDVREEVIAELQASFPSLMTGELSIGSHTAVFFDVDQYEISDDALPYLREFVILYRHEFENPDSILTIKGYCDRTASFDYNYRLSRRRAASVLQFFFNLLGPAFAIKQENIFIDGYGEADAAEELPDETDEPYYRRVDVTLNDRVLIERTDE